MEAKAIIDYLENLSPSFLQEKWDNSGVQIGSLKKEIKNILLAIDLTEGVVDDAINNNFDMIITHHPFFFSNIKNIIKDTYKGRIIYKLINNDILVYTQHTNLDASKEGVSYYLARELGLKNIKPLNVVYKEKLYKVVVFVPDTHVDLVRKALTDNGAGFIGNYSHCTFNTQGTGTFMPRENTKPFIGQENRLEFTKETRIETIVKEIDLNKVLKEMIRVHPYEEVAYDVYELKNDSEELSIGKMGELDSEINLYEFAKKVKVNLNCDTIRIYGDIKQKIKKVAVCGGEGSDLFKEASLKGADVFVTGDIKHHIAQKAKELNLSIIDTTHYNSEKIILKYLEKRINNKFKNITTKISDSDNFANFLTI